MTGGNTERVTAVTQPLNNNHAVISSFPDATTVLLSEVLPTEVLLRDPVLRS